MIDWQTGPLQYNCSHPLVFHRFPWYAKAEPLHLFTSTFDPSPRSGNSTMSNQPTYPVSERWRVSGNGKALEAQLRFPTFKKTWVSVLPPPSLLPTPITLVSNSFQMIPNLGESGVLNPVYHSRLLGIHESGRHQCG